MPKRSRQPSPEPVVSDIGPTGFVLVAGSNDCGQLGIVGQGTRAKPGAPVIKLPPAGDGDLSDRDREILQQQELFTQAWWQTRAVRQVAAGAVHSVCLLRGNLNNTSSTTNCAITFGAAEDGQCGIVEAAVGRNDIDSSGGSKSEATPAKIDPDDIPDYFPTLLNGLPTDTVQIAAGDAFTAALTDNGGHVYMTGSFRTAQGSFACFDSMTRITGRRNLRRKAAVGSTTPSSTSKRGEASHVRVTKIVAGSSHIAVLDENGNVYTMGRFQEGQLGRIQGAKKASTHMENWALQLEQVMVTRTAAQLRRAKNVGGAEADAAKRPRSAAARPTRLDKITARFSDVWATPLGLFLRDAEIDAVYACGSNSAGQLGLPLKWNVTNVAQPPSRAAAQTEAIAKSGGKQKRNQPPPPAQQPQQNLKQVVGYFRGRKVVQFRQKPTITDNHVSASAAAVTAETVDNNLIDLDITVEFPEHVPGLDGLDIVQIVGSEVHTLALTRSGEVYVFGSNKFYALGLSQAQLCSSFARDINQNRLMNADEISDDSDDNENEQLYAEQLQQNDEIIQERLRDPIFVPITRLLPAAAAANFVAPAAAETDADDDQEAGGKKKRRKIEPAPVSVSVVPPPVEQEPGGNIALRQDEPIESIAAGSRQSYFITRNAGRLYRCGDNNNKLMFIRVMDELEDDDEKYVENVDYLTRGSNNVQDVALLRPLLYESEVLNDRNRVLSIAVGGQHALLLAERNQ